MADNKGATKAELVKFVQEEIAQTEEALAFVVESIASGRHKQFTRTLTRKQSEYEGVLWAYNAVLDLAEGKVVENVSSDVPTSDASDSSTT